MLASLFHLKSLGCCGCLSTLIVLAVAGVLLLAVLGIAFPDVIVPDIPEVTLPDTLCQYLPEEASLCLTPIPYQP